MDKDQKKTWDALTLPAGLDDVSDRDDVMTIGEFVECVQSGGFIDYDGFGQWATATKKMPIFQDAIYPSNIMKGKSVPPAWATHVVWYNR